MLLIEVGILVAAVLTLIVIVRHYRLDRRREQRASTPDIEYVHERTTPTC